MGADFDLLSDSESIEDLDPEVSRHRSLYLSQIKFAHIGDAIRVISRAIWTPGTQAGPRSDDAIIDAGGLLGRLAISRDMPLPDMD